MRTMQARRFAILPLTALLGVVLWSFLCLASSWAQEAAASSGSKAIGTIKELNGAAITLAPDSGPPLNISVQPATQLLRVEPGAKTLVDAAPMSLQDLQVGDRIRVTGKMSDDGHTLLAAKIIAIKHADLEARHQQELQAWQKNGVDGLATAVDSSAGTVTITIRNKPVIVHVSSTTVIRRYPPDSVKFDDAKPSTLAAIHTGDQVRARGNRSADGGELTADEIVSGTFRNIAGTVNSVDASSSSLSVHDLLSKKNITIQITADSQLRKLSPEMAQRIAARLKGSAGGAASGSGEAPSGAPSSAAPPSAAQTHYEAQTAHQWGDRSGAGSSAGGSGASPGAPRGAPDFQQLLSRLPAEPLSDLHKGDAVVLVSTEGTDSVATAIILLSGVEPILQAAPSASSYSILSPWSLGAPSGDAGGP